MYCLIALALFLPVILAQNALGGVGRVGGGHDLGSYGQPCQLYGQYGQYPGQYGGYPGQYGGYPGQYGGYPGQYGGYPGQYGRYPGQYGRYPGQDGRGQFGGLSFPFRPQFDETPDVAASPVPAADEANAV